MLPSLSSISDNFILRSSKSFKLFGEYCSLLNYGFRKDALKKLESFLKETKEWNFQDRVDFCNFLFKQLSSSEETDFGILKIPLMERLIRPALEELKEKEPSNFLPFKWEGQWCRNIESAKKAYELNPIDESVKILLLKRLEYVTWLSVHHLPEDYHGDIQKDELNIELAFKLIQQVEPSKIKDYCFDERFHSYKELLQSYKSKRATTT